MSHTRVKSVLDSPVPVNAKQLKSFLGTVNHFRDFIRNQYSLVHLLHVLIADYHKTRRIQWTTEDLKASNYKLVSVLLCIL